MEQIRFRTAGDSALLAEFDNVISFAENRKVRALKAALERKAIPGVGEAVPAYRSLLIRYDPCRISDASLKEAVEGCLETLSDVELPPPVVVEIPVCYEGDYAPDLDDIARMEQKTTDEIVAIHSGEDYFIYMLGFTPGQPYGARMGSPFSFGRRTTPRVRMRAGSIAVQKALTCILPFDQPCGWNILGTTPLRVFDARKKDPFLLQSGQWFRHVPISPAEFETIAHDVENGTYVPRTFVKEVLP